MNLNRITGPVKGWNWIKAVTQTVAPTHIDGLGLSQDTDTSHDILVATGECADSTGVVLQELTTAMNKKLDAVHVAGDDAGGLATPELNSGINLTFNDNGGSPDDITAASGTPFSTSSVGDTLIITDSSSNNGNYQITSVTSDTVVEVVTGSFVNEGPVAAKAYTILINSTYHVYIIDSASVAVDVMFDTSTTAANIPSSYTRYRLLGSVVTGSAANITNFVQYEFGRTRRFVYDIPISDWDVVNPGTSAVTRTLSVATGIPVYADITVSIHTIESNAVEHWVLITDLSATDTTPSDTAHQCFAATAAAGGIGQGSANLQIRTNTSGQVRSRIAGAVDVATTFRGTIHGYTQVL